MSLQPLGLAGAGQAAVVAQQQARQGRDDQKENSTRDARNSFTLAASGVGSAKLAVPVVFDCKFVEEPHVASGVAIQIGPDEHYYELPTVTVGVLRWVKEPQQPPPDNATNDPGALPNLAVAGSGLGSNVVYNGPEDVVPMFYTGAYLYVRVNCDLKANVSLLTAEQHPAQPRLHLHVSFFGTAMKVLADSITATADDPTVAPRPTPIAGGTT